jgi:hypothetical protein
MIEKYPGFNQCFIGKNAPENAIKFIQELRGKPYNAIIDCDTVFISPRSYSSKTRQTGTLMAGLEMSGGFVVGSEAAALLSFEDYIRILEENVEQKYNLARRR